MCRTGKTSAQAGPLLASTCTSVSAGSSLTAVKPGMVAIPEPELAHSGGGGLSPFTSCTASMSRLRTLQTHCKPTVHWTPGHSCRTVRSGPDCGTCTEGCDVSESWADSRSKAHLAASCLLPRSRRGLVRRIRPLGHPVWVAVSSSWPLQMASGCCLPWGRTRPADTQAKPVPSSPRSTAIMAQGAGPLIVAGREHAAYCFEVLSCYFSGESPGSPRFADHHWYGTHRPPCP